MTAAVQVDPYTVDQQQGLTPEEEAALAVLATFLASVAAVRAVTLPGYLVDRMVALGLNRRAVRAAGKLTLEPALTGRTRWGSPTVADFSQPNPFDPMSDSPVETASPGSARSQGPVLSILGPRGSASERARAAITAGKTVSRFGPPTMVKRMAANEPLMRARYLLAAAKRLAKAATEARFTAALRREQAYLEAHRRAGKRRSAAARAYDIAARGQLFMMWVTAGDSRVDPHCRALEGSVWSVDNPPIPCPGAAHPACRCVARPLGSRAAAQAAA